MTRQTFSGSGLEKLFPGYKKDDGKFQFRKAFDHVTSILRTIGSTNLVLIARLAMLAIGYISLFREAFFIRKLSNRKLWLPTLAFENPEES